MLEFAHTDYEIYASMFAGIKCQDDRAGERGARPDWVWEFWQNDWTFREDSEVWGMCVPAALHDIPLIYFKSVPCHLFLCYWKIRESRQRILS